MHLGDPVPKTVEDQPLYDGVIRLQSIASSGEVRIVCAKAKCRPVLIALGSMVIDDVEDDFDPGTM
jgi:hypothetical protein